MLPDRKTLPHDIPSWVDDGAEYYITICCQRRGKNQLCREEIAALIRESIQFRQQRGEWWVHLLLLMPDHLHAIMSFSPMYGMKRSISQWKRFVATNSQVVWQRDFFDHRLRSDESYLEKAHYIRMNPVRAGLVPVQEEWKWIWEGRNWQGGQ